LSLLKTYQQIDNLSDSINFRIERIEDIYDRRNGEADEPHRHNYYTVILTKTAKGRHIIDFNEYEMSDKQLHFVSPEQVHQIIESEKSFGYVLLFSTQFLIENNIPSNFIEDLNLFNNYGQSPPLPINEEQLLRFSNYCQEIMKWNNSNMKFKEQALGAFLKLLLIETNNLCSLSSHLIKPIEIKSSIVKNFKNLVNQKYSHWHSSSEYANHLNISPDHLNRTIKNLIGKSAKEYIQNRITIAAKRLLYFSELSNKEIGFELGFEESSNFSAFFKKNAGKSPSDFRKDRHNYKLYS